MTITLDQIIYEPVPTGKYPARVTAIEEAELQAKQEVRNLKEQAEKNRQQLHDKTSKKIPAAVAKVMQNLKG